MRLSVTKITCLLIALLAAVSGHNRVWRADSLAGYERTTISLPKGRVCTVVRKQSACGGNRGVLYIHGYNDYFFQAEEGDRFVDSCYNWYAVDLHGYGRSIKPGERPYQSDHIADYYLDIDSALSVMKSDGVTRVALMGHSTGGLISASYMAFGHPSRQVRALILNSPFLQFNFNEFMLDFALPAVQCFGSHFPGVALPQSYDDTAYGESCSADFHGEWHYNYAWKTLHPRPITTGWISMIGDAQHRLTNNPERICVPILLMHSARSIDEAKWTPAHQSADAVLNVAHIKNLGRKLGPSVTEFTVRGGMHDLFLSAPRVRNALYNSVFRWLRNRL